MAESTKKNQHDEFLNKIKTNVNRSNETFVKHHKDNYNGELPVWVLIEILSFGDLCKLFKLAKPEDKKSISKYFGISDTEYFYSLIISLAEFRNVCAHHCRLWNRGFGKLPKSASGKEPSRLKHLNTTHKAQGKIRRGGLFTLLTCLLYMLEHTGKTRHIGALILVVDDFPEEKGKLEISSMGFPWAWKELDPWKNFRDLR